MKGIQQNSIDMALKIFNQFNHAQSQATMKIRSVFNSAHFLTYPRANEA